MAFLDNIEKKITRTGQSVVQKTKEMADIAKMNSAISEEERKLNGNYANIGMLYVKLHEADYEESFNELVDGIKESERKISEYKQRILTIRGVVLCEKCGAEIPSNTAFCGSCGAAAPKCEEAENSEGMIRCMGCGQMVSREIKFCTSCGKAVAESLVQDEDIQAAEKRSCPNCGGQIDIDSKFCTICGQPVAEGEQMKEVASAQNCVVETVEESNSAEVPEEK